METWFSLGIVLLLLLQPSHGSSFLCHGSCTIGPEVGKVSFLILTTVSKLFLLSPVLLPDHPILPALKLSTVNFHPSCLQSPPDPLGYTVIQYHNHWEVSPCRLSSPNSDLSVP